MEQKVLLGRCCPVVGSNGMEDSLAENANVCYVCDEIPYRLSKAIARDQWTYMYLRERSRPVDPPARDNHAATRPMPATKHGELLRLTAEKLVTTLIDDQSMQPMKRRCGLDDQNLIRHARS